MLLPPTTQPPSTAIERRHSPPRAGFQSYRPCLRWDFGFTCAFCLLHETDLGSDLSGIEGTGLTTIEHWHPQSAAPELANEYSNCLYACRFCNRSRGTSPVESPADGRLLNPCANVWSEHFTARGDRIVVAREDRDALRTERVYDLNDPRKVALRRRRRELIEAALATIREASTIPELILIAEHLDGSEREEVIRAAEFLRDQVNRARGQLVRLEAVPVDVDLECRCQRVEFSLAPHLARQCVPHEAMAD